LFEAIELDDWPDVPLDRLAPGMLLDGARSVALLPEVLPYLLPEELLPVLPDVLLPELVLPELVLSELLPDELS
jgi:hypothetical protein